MRLSVILWELKIGFGTRHVHRLGSDPALEVTMTPESSAVSFVSAFVVTHRERLFAVSVGLAALVFLTLTWSLLSTLAMLPLLAGATVTALASERVSALVNGFELVLSRWHESSVHAAGRFRRYAARPAIATSLWVLQRSSGLRGEHLRAGVSTAGVGFVMLGFLVACVVAAYAALFVVLTIAVLAFFYFLLSGGFSSDES